MNQNQIQGAWKEIKGAIRTKFAKFTDDDIESFKGNLGQIAGRLQKVYGYAQERAEQEYNELKSSISKSIDEMNASDSTTTTTTTITSKDKS